MGSTPEIDGTNEERSAGWWILVALIVVTIGLEWLRPLGSSYWLDESGTVWVIKGGLSQAFHRSLLIQGQTPAYYLIAWVVRHIGGTSEALLRSVSLDASAAAAVVVYRIARRWFDAEGSALAVLVFVASANTAFAASDARPYALASLLSLAALLNVMRWVERDRVVDALLAGVLTAAAIYVHYLFALVIPIQVLFLWLRYRAGWRSKRRAVIAAVGITLLLLAPTVPQMLDLIRRRGALSFATGPTVVDLFRVIGLPLLLLLAGLILERLGTPASVRSDPARGEVLTFNVVWSLFAPLTLLVASWATTVVLFVPRYFLTAVGGTAMLGAWAIRKFQTVPLRAAVAAALAIASILTISSSSHTNEDWRAAARAVRQDARANASGAVLLWTGLVESRQASLLDDPRRNGFLLSPAVAYPFSHPVYALPFDRSAGVQPYLNHLLTQVAREKIVYFVSSRQPEPFVAWFAQRLHALRQRTIGVFGRIQVVALGR